MANRLSIIATARKSYVSGWCILTLKAIRAWRHGLHQIEISRSKKVDPVVDVVHDGTIVLQSSESQQPRKLGVRDDGDVQIPVDNCLIVTS